MVALYLVETSVIYEWLSMSCSPVSFFIAVLIISIIFLSCHSAVEMPPRQRVSTFLRDLGSFR